MNHRLVWNVEINGDLPLDFQALPQEEAEILRWEARFFWNDNSIITLYGLSNELLDLTRYQIKQRYDLYYVHPTKTFNIKERRHELLYKPLLEKNLHCLGFGKKINLLDASPEAILPGIFPATTKQLLEIAQFESKKMHVEKVALIHKFPTTPPIKLELARLIIAGNVFFSVCIEGRSQELVTILSKRLLNEPISCDYVHFLQQI